VNEADLTPFGPLLRDDDALRIIGRKVRQIATWALLIGLALGVGLGWLLFA
jgi:hypothetical protein